MSAFLRIAIVGVLATLVGCTNNNVSTPEPISFGASASWDGNDGPWSSFAFQIGYPPQVVRLLPSTSTSALLVVGPDTCSVKIPGSCDKARGQLFNISSSTSWKVIGNFDIANQAGEYLGYNGAAAYGTDFVTLGWPGTGGPALSSQVVGTSGSGDYYTGIFGLSPQPNNFTDFNDMKPSLMGHLKDRKLIPSSSYAYTAGVCYRDRKPLASLTLGGYDSSQFIPNNVTFPFSTDVSRRLLVNLRSIKKDEPVTEILRSPVFAFIDSTDPFLWLPMDACRKLEEAFNLIWNEPEQMYFFTTSPNTTVKRQTDTSITFTLAENSTTSSTVEIVFPFSAFEQLASPPITRNGTTQRYFPLKRGLNDTQYVLGRTFLQEAYLIVDHERSTFSVSQAAFPGPGINRNIVPILPVEKVNPPAKPNKFKSKRAIAGTVIAIVGTLICGIFLVSWFHKREGRQRRARSRSRGIPFSKSELETTEVATLRHEVDGKQILHLSPIEIESPIERLELSARKERANKLLAELEGKTLVMELDSMQKFSFDKTFEVITMSRGRDLKY